CTRLCRPLPRLSANPPGVDVLRRTAGTSYETALPDVPGAPFAGADDGTRTRDPHLGKVMLYQLSHVRVSAVPTRRDSTRRHDPEQTEGGTPWDTSPCTDG